MSPDDIRRALRDLMKARGSTQTKLARALGKPQNWIQRRFNDPGDPQHTKMTIEEADSIARLLGARVSVLVVRDPDEKGEPSEAWAAADPADRVLAERILRVMSRITPSERALLEALADAHGTDT